MIINLVKKVNTTAKEFDKDKDEAKLFQRIKEVDKDANEFGTVCAEEMNLTNSEKNELISVLALAVFVDIKSIMKKIPDLHVRVKQMKHLFNSAQLQ